MDLYWPGNNSSELAPWDDIENYTCNHTMWEKDTQDVCMYGITVICQFAVLGLKERSCVQLCLCPIQFGEDLAL